VAKVIVDAWFSHTRVHNSRCINQLNHYQVHANFFRPLAEWSVLNVNPFGELNLDAILRTNPAESNNTYQRKTRKFGVWDREVIENFNDLGVNVDNITDHTKVICRGLPLEFALFMDRNFPNYFEDCIWDSTKLMYVPAAKKTHQFWIANRQTSRFPRDTITIPTAALGPVIPAPVLNRENTLAQQIITLTNERDTAITQGNGLAAERTTLLAEQDAAIAQCDAAIGLGLTASAEGTTAVAERNTAKAERGTAIAERDTAIAERNTAVAQQNTPGQNVITAQRDTAIAERDAAIANLNIAIEKWEAAIDDRNTAQAKSERLEKDCQRNLHAISKLQQENEQLQNSVQELEAQLLELRNKYEEEGIHTSVTQ
jgi:hypothetical protein